MLITNSNTVSGGLSIKNEILTSIGDTVGFNTLGVVTSEGETTTFNTLGVVTSEGETVTFSTTTQT